MKEFLKGFEKRAFNVLNRAASKSNTGTSSFFNFGGRGKGSSGTAAAPTQQAQRGATTASSGRATGGPNISTRNANAMRSAFGG